MARLIVLVRCDACGREFDTGIRMATRNFAKATFAANYHTCPHCGHAATESMGRESVKKVYHCKNCLSWLAPKHGDHCIYDSYGSVPCPARQLKAKAASQRLA